MPDTLFALTGAALSLQRQIDATAEQLFSDDPDEVAIATTTLESLISAEADSRQAIASKADAWCWVIDSLRAQAIARREHAARLADLASTAEHQAEVLQERLIHALQCVDPDATSWKLPEHTLSSRKVTSIELDPDLDAADLPLQFQRVKTTTSADKTALKAALLLGQEIPGVTLSERRSWRIG